MRYLRGLLSTLLLTLAFNTQAVLITENMDVEVVFGVGAGTTGTVEFEYDDSLITGVGDETLDGSEFTMVLDLFGQIFTEVNDIDFPGFPELIFTDGVITGIDLIIEEDDTSNPTAINQDGIVLIEGGVVFNDVLLLETNSVPEPAALILMLTGLLALRRRR